MSIVRKRLIQLLEKAIGAEFGVQLEMRRSLSEAAQRRLVAVQRAALKADATDAQVDEADVITRAMEKAMEAQRILYPHDGHKTEEFHERGREGAPRRYCRTCADLYEPMVDKEISPGITISQSAPQWIAAGVPVPDDIADARRCLSEIKLGPMPQEVRDLLDNYSDALQSHL